MDRHVTHLQRPRLALGLRVVAALLVSTMFLFGKLAGQHGVSLPEIMFWRQAITLPILFGWLLAHGQVGRLRTAHPVKHLLRAVVGSAGMAFNFGAVMLLHLSESTTLNFTAPLFAVILAATFLHEAIGRWRWTAVACGFAGVALIAQPGHSPIPPLGAVVGLLAAMFNAVISFQLRDLGRTEEPITVVFWFAVFGATVTLPVLPFVMHAHDGATWAILLGVGLAGTFGQMFMTSALRYGPVASVIVMDYSQLLWATALGWLVWGEMPSSTTWLGAPLIVAAGLVIAWREHRQVALARRPAPA